MANVIGRRLNVHLSTHQSQHKIGCPGKQDATLLNEPQNCAVGPKKYWLRFSSFRLYFLLLG